MNIASLKILPRKPNWDKTMVKKKSTTHIFLPLIKTLLDISETMHSNLISQLLKYWCWQSLVNKFTRLSLEWVFERLSHHFVEDHVWKRLLVKYVLSDLLWLYPPFNWAIYYFRIWWLKYPFQKKIGKMHKYPPSLCPKSQRHT